MAGEVDHMVHPGIHRRIPRRGISFIEILFAVILLGIGLIMIAAMMPVAMVQSQETVDQTVAAQIAKGAAEAIEGAAEQRTMPSTAELMSTWQGGKAPVWSMADHLKYTNQYTYLGDGARRPWQLLRGKMIHTADPRYAWTAVYSREYNGSLNRSTPYAQVYIVVGRVRNRSRYGPEDTQGERPNLRMREVDVYLTEGTANGVPAPDIVEFASPWTGAYAKVDTPSAVAEGTFVIIAEDNQLLEYRTSATGSYKRSSKGLANGRVYRVGNRRPDLGPRKWELMPGWDMASGPGCGGPGDDLILNTADDNQNMPITRSNPRYAFPARAFILGRESVDPANAVQFDGPAQDVAFFTTFVPVLR